MSANEYGKFAYEHIITQGDIAFMLLALELRRQRLKWWQWYEALKIVRSQGWLEALNEWIAYGKKSYQVRVVLDRGAGL